MTIGVLALRPFRSFSSHSSCSLPKPPALAEAARHAARHRPDDAGAGPGHAFEEPAPAGAGVSRLLRIHDVRSFASTAEAEIGGSADLFAAGKIFRMAGINRRPRRSCSE